MTLNVKVVLDKYKDVGDKITELNAKVKDCEFLLNIIKGNSKKEAAVQSDLGKIQGQLKLLEEQKSYYEFVLEKDL